MPARWRALKRLAIQGHDTDRELQFFSGELRSQRFAEHWPLPWPVWKRKPWGGLSAFGPACSIGCSRISGGRSPGRWLLAAGGCRSGDLLCCAKPEH